MSIVFVGEAWGEAETKYGEAFVGSAGQELYRLLARAGFPCESLSYNYISPFSMSMKWSRFPHPLLSTFNSQPKDNQVETFYGSLKGATALDRTLPARKFGASTHYVLEEMAAHVRQLHAELERLRPNLIVPLGATACWALGLGSAITKLRGFVHETPWGKALPTYHPAAVLRNWSLRVSVLLDLVKARREMGFAEIRTISREIWTEPTIPDLWQWWDQHGSKSPLISVDIETLKRQQISEVGFAASPIQALHIPFCYKEKKEYVQWWPTVKEEVEAWRFVKHVCESDTPKILQNFQYDSYWLAKEAGIVVRNVAHDTMQLQHCWQPELEKSLSFLGSVWLDERSWKSIRHDTGKDFE